MSVIEISRVQPGHVITFAKLAYTFREEGNKTVGCFRVFGFVEGRRETLKEIVSSFPVSDLKSMTFEVEYRLGVNQDSVAKLMASTMASMIHELSKWQQILEAQSTVHSILQTLGEIDLSELESRVAERERRICQRQAIIDELLDMES